MIEDGDALEQRELPHSCLRVAPRDPPFEHSLAEQVLDPPHRGRALLLLALVVIRRDEGNLSAAAGAKERTFLHLTEQQVPCLVVVAVHDPTQRCDVESRRLLGEVGRGVVEARGEHDRGRGGVGEGSKGTEEVASDNRSSTGNRRGRIHDSTAEMKEGSMARRLGKSRYAQIANLPFENSMQLYPTLFFKRAHKK